MKRFLLLLILCPSFQIVSAQDSITGDFLAYIEGKISALPGRDTDDFDEPTVSQSSLWVQAISELMNDQYAQCHSTLTGLDYRLVQYTDHVSGSIFYIVEKRAASSNHWGIYVFNPKPLRPTLVIQAPHPKYDSKTGLQASYVFREIQARALNISGTHRCNSGIASSCSGTTEACDGGPYKISDNAHNVNTPFQSTTELLFNSIPNSIFIQLHGFFKAGSDPYVIMSNGTDLQPTSTDFLVQIRNELLIEDNTLTFKIAHLDNWTKLTGTTNVQGRLVNSVSNPCQNAAPGNNGRFIHLEQEKSRLRNDVSGWTKVSNAISRVFPVSILINEIHADPAGDISGDANKDGIRDSSDDEFIEIVNTSSIHIDVSGYKIYDTNSQFILRHTFPDGSLIPPGEAIVIFGGGTPSGSFGTSLVQTASTGALGITNSSETLVIQDTHGKSIITHSYGGEANNNQSITRFPDITGSNTPMAQHSLTPGSSGALYSPGTKTDGSNFGLPSPPSLLINEIHADPANDISGDANADGVRNSTDDEFIEVVNIGLINADISGYKIYDTNSQFLLRHEFPTGTILPAGKAIVIFGGGTPSGNFGNSLVQTASSGALGLTNTSETVEIRDAFGDQIITYSYSNEANSNQSIVRSPDLTGSDAPMSQHALAINSSGTLYSPGTRIDGSNFGSPIAAFEASHTSIIEGSSITFTDLSTDVPSAWSWDFPGGSPSSSSNQNPQVVYNTAGNYDVSLNVSNADGSHVISKSNYITVASNCQTVDDEDFEITWGIWNDGGSDARRSSNDAAFANSGSYPIRLRDNTNSSVMTTDNLDLATYATVEISFSYITNSMDNSNEDFWLQVSTDGGGTFTTVEEWNLNDEFVNNQRYNEKVEISTIQFTQITKFRFRCDASSNADQVYIDDIEIKGCSASGARTSLTKKETLSFDTEWLDNQESKPVQLFPNPANESVTLNLADLIGQRTSIHIHNLQGEKLKSLHIAEVSDQQVILELSEFNNGIYMIMVEAENRVKSINKLVIRK